MSYINYSPWTDAANYGRGLGESLGNAMIQMPQQRMQLAAQQAQARQQQQMEMLKYALQQKAQQDQMGLGQSELDLKRQEMLHNQEFHNAEVDTARIRAQNEAKGTWKFGQDKDGRAWKMNTLTGQHEWLPEPEEAPGLGGVPKPATGGQQLKNTVDVARLYGSALGATNIGAIDPKFLGALSNMFYNGAPPQRGSGAMPTNAPALPPQLGGATNRIGRFLVQPVE
jgi:hypothetical protein